MRWMMQRSWQACVAICGLCWWSVLAAASTLAPSADALNFGAVRATNATPAEITRTVRYDVVGDASVTISGVDVSGAGFRLLASSPALPATLAVGESIELTLGFDPTGEGAYSGFATPTSDAESASAVALQGEGTLAVLGSVEAALDFANVRVGASASQTLHLVRASGTGVLTLPRTRFWGGDSPWFFVRYNGCGPGMPCIFTPPLLPTNQAVPLEIVCAPPAYATPGQVATTELEFLSDGDAGSLTSLPLRCVAARAQPAVSTTSLVFGVVSRPGSQTLSFTLSNGATANAELAASVQSSSTEFAVAAGPYLLAPGQSQQIAVQFAPTASGPRTAGIVVSTDDTAVPRLDIAVSGTGLTPAASFEPPSVAFGEVAVSASSATATVRLRNTGDGLLTVASMVATQAAFVIVNAPSSAQLAAGIAPNGMLEWQLACRPNAEGAVSGQLVATTNAYPSGTVTLPLTCTGHRMSLTATPATVSFGTVAVGNNEVRLVQLMNNGSAALTSLTASLSAGAAGFTITAMPAATLAAGATTSLGIKCEPTGNGGLSATLNLVSAWAGAGAAPSLSVPLTCTGATVALVAEALTVAAKVRFDRSTSGTFEIKNPSGVSVVLDAVAFEPADGTNSTEVTVDNVRGTTLAAGGKRTVGITIRPNARIGVVAGTLVARSQAGYVGVGRLNVSVQSVSATVETSALEVDFGARDLDNSPAVTQVVRLTNTSTEPFELSQVALATGSSNAFRLGAFTLRTIAAGQQFDLPVTFTPTVQRPANAPERATVEIRLAGVYNLGLVSFRLEGRGIDRSLQLGLAPVFPDTFRNPGKLATVRTFTVGNTGEAPLVIRPELVDATGVWSLVDAAVEQTLAAGQEAKLAIRFAPTATGLAPAAVLRLAHNDNEKPVAELPLQGRGIDRSVDFAPGLIVFPETAAGVPVTMSQAGVPLLEVRNRDGAVTFQVAKIVVTGDAAFALPAEVQGALAPGELRSVDLRFAPTAAGRYTATAELYLDDDPLPAGQVTVTGQAVAVELDGGAGCASSAATSWLWLVGLLGWRRRRAWAVAAMLLWPRGAGAEALLSKSLDLALWRVLPTAAPRYVQTESAIAPEGQQLSVSCALSHANRPLVSRVVLADLTMEEAVLIRNRSTLELGVSYAFFRGLEVGVALPLYYQEGDSASLPQLSRAQGAALGDVALRARGTLWSSRRWATGVSGTLTLPTATAAQLAGVEKPSGHGVWLITLRGPAWSLSSNVGYLLRAKTQYANVQGSDVTYAAAGAWTVHRDVDLVVDVFGHAPATTGGLAGAAMAMGGFQVQIDRQVRALVSVGRGIVSGPGAPAWMGMLSLTYAPTRGPEQRVPVLREVEGDRDGDGVLDGKDRCPDRAEDRAEDRDLFEDDDGCPELDNDGDGVPDAHDKCVASQEDRDGFEDEDGCPERDNDRDGLPDAHDRCPLEAEDKDGFEDTDGCPEADNDRDGLLDGVDRCPLAAEVINGVVDEDGCPDAGAPSVVLGAARFELIDPLVFTAAAQLERTAAKVLGQVAAQLRAHPEIKRLRIVVHTHAPRATAAAQRQAETRAAAIKEWLVQWGIAPERLEPQGLGASKPLVPVGTKHAKAINERVELIVIERE